MKDLTVAINSALKNKGISFQEDVLSQDLFQAWSYFTRFLIDLIECKSEEFLISDNTPENREKYRKHLIGLMEDWIKVLDDIKVEEEG